MVEFWPFFKTYRHRCPDGSSKLVHRSIDDAFPLYFSNHQGQFDAQIEALKKAAVKAKAQYAATIQSLLFRVDELNQSLMLTFRGAYVAYQTDPCQNGEFFTREVEKLISDQKQLTRIKLQIGGLIELAKLHPDQPEQLLPLFREIVNQIGGSTVPELANIEIQSLRSVAKTWTGSS